MANVAEIAAGVAVELVVAAVALGVLYRMWGWFFPVPKRQTILAFQRGVLINGGQVEKVLSPGIHWITPKHTLLICDMRSKPFQVPGQELLTSDGMAVRVSLGGEYRIVDPALFVKESSDAFGAFYIELKQALHVAVSELKGEAFLAGEAQLVPRIRELLVPRGTNLGINLTLLEVFEAAPVGWLRED